MVKTEKKVALLSSIYEKLAFSFHLLEEHEVSIYYYTKQLQIALDTNLKDIETKIYDNIGMEYYYLGDMEKAAVFHHVAMQGGLGFEKDELYQTRTIKSIIKRKMLYSTKADMEFKTLSDLSNEIHLQARYQQKMRYLKEKEFHETLTNENVRKIKKKYYMSIVPFIRSIEVRIRLKALLISDSEQRNNGRLSKIYK